MRHSSEISPKNSNHPHISSFSMQGSANYDSKTLTPNRNSLIDLKQVKPKIGQKSSKNSKVPLKPNICDSKSSSGLILPCRKKPPAGSQIKVKLKNLKDKTLKSFNNQTEKKSDKKVQNLFKTTDCEVKYIEEVPSNLNENCTLINKTRHKKSFSLNLDLIENSCKILSDQRMYSKPLKTTKNAKVKPKKMFGSSKKLEKNASSFFKPEPKISIFETPDNRIVEISVKNKEFEPKTNSSKPKSKVNISLSPKFSQKKMQPLKKDPKQVKGIIRASRYNSVKNEIDNTLTGENKTLNDSNKSSMNHTETDEWVNFIDYNFEGTASGFVEEFKAKILEDFLLATKNLLNEGRIHNQLVTTENLYTEDLDLSPSDSISYEKPMRNTRNLNNPKSQQVFIPKLALNEIITQDSPSFLYDTLNEANYTSEMLEGDIGSSYKEIGNTKNEYFFVSSTKDGSPDDERSDFVGFRNKGK